MARRKHRFIIEHPDRESFFRIIKQHYPTGSDEYTLIAKAYDTAKQAFRHQVRDTGER